MKRTTLGLSVTAALASLLIACSSAAEPLAASPPKAPAAASTTAAAAATTAPAATTAASTPAGNTAATGTAATTGTPAASTPVAPAAPTVVTVAAGENGEKYFFDPATFTVKAGEVTVRFSNKGRREHTLIITNPAGGRDIADTGRVESGNSTELKFRVTAPGQYRFLCAIEGHEDRGQVGTMTVTG